MEDLKKKNRTGAEKYFNLPEKGFKPQIFSIFPDHDLNFHRREGEEIKSKQASKRDKTLQIFTRFENMFAYKQNLNT